MASGRQADLDARIERYRFHSASDQELRAALANARPGMAVPESWPRFELIRECRRSGVDLRPARGS